MDQSCPIQELLPAQINSVTFQWASVSLLTSNTSSSKGGPSLRRTPPKELGFGKKAPTYPK
jgi:hypothetical protein